MKKIVSVLLALVMALSLGVSAFATDVTVDGSQSADTTVTYGLDSSYLVVIPESVVIDTNTHKGEATVSAENVLLGYGETLNITVANAENEDKWYLVDKTAADNTLEYTIGKTDGAADVTNESVVLSVAAGDKWNEKVEQALYFELAEDVTKAGDYSDTLTFTVDVA